MTNETYLVWYDDNPKTPIAARIARGAVAYYERYDVSPAVVMISYADLDAMEKAGGTLPDGMTAVPQAFVRRNNYWLGMEELP